MIYIDKQEKSNNILLIDINVPDYQEVVDSVNSNTLAIVYDYNDTYEDLAILQNYDISRVGIFFESNKPFLNGSFFETVQSMINLINHHKIPHIDFLACNTLNDPEWTNYYKQLPCIVGASNNETGNIEYGGDWIMESTGENIEFVYFKDIKYKHLLKPNYIQSSFGAYSTSPLFARAITVMKNTSSTYITVNMQKGGNSQLFMVRPYSKTPTLDYSGYFSQKDGGDLNESMVIYKSAFNCPAIANPSNEYLMYISPQFYTIYMVYNIATPSSSSSSLNRVDGNLIVTGGTFDIHNGLAIYQNNL